MPIIIFWTAVVRNSLMPAAMEALSAVILAGGNGNNLHPLNSGDIPKCLLPVANRPLLTFPVQMLEEGGVTEIFIVCAGEKVASSVKAWTSQQHVSIARIEIVKVSEDTSVGDALRAVIERIKTLNFVLLSGDVVTDVSLKAQLVTHHVTDAAATALFARRKVSPCSETKPGYAPRGVDYIGLADGNRLIYYAHSPEALRELRMPAAAAKHWITMKMGTDLVDMQVYIFSTALLASILTAKPDLKDLEGSLLPCLVHQQLCPQPQIQEASGRDGWYCAAVIAPVSNYCQRANTIEGYLDVNREVLNPDLAQRLLREPANEKYDNFLHTSVQTGVKTTVASGCMIGAESVLGDKCSVKRSVLGNGCRIGNSVKIINSVIMDDVLIADGCYLQNSIICSHCRILERVNLKDCQVAPGFTVQEGIDAKGQIFNNSV